MKQAIFHPEARHELTESVSFYEARYAGLGLRFLAAVETTTGRIEEQPDAGSPLEGGYRKWIVAGFPFNVIYRVWDDYVYLVAVAHHRRRPDYWRDRQNRR